ncbi:imidazolonepropionase [Algimonas arctica]|uniref:imidazolonepropionase n=1 Tax=Algimonas arctica TaxID=1479486 RepID=UPI001F17FE36|nr:imidazolonepropionase [Algimonas arctica]
MQQSVLVNAQIATMGPSATPYGLIEGGAVAIENNKVTWCGPLADMPQPFEPWRQRNLEGRLVTPALVDCHTHIVHAGNRAKEFEMRLNGATYEDIARAGGGIVSTVTATRAASEDELFASAAPRVEDLIAEGVCTLEIKSGYGLDFETELKMLRVARRIGAHYPIRVRTTFLGAHATPEAYKGYDDRYIDEVCIPALEAAQAEGLVDAVDGFCESIGFTPDQIKRVFSKAKDLGLPVKLHAEQLSNLGGAALAAHYNALSADHLEYLDDAGVSAMARSGTIPVLLPSAYYFLRDTQPPPIQSFRDAGLPMAIATDCNPGSSPMTSLLLAMNMACTLFRMTPEEALAGTTRNAAAALGLKDTGIIAPGFRADLAIWNAQHPAELSYGIGINCLHDRIFGGAV